MELYNEELEVDLTENEKEEIKLGIEQLDAGQRICLTDFLKSITK